MKNLELLRTPGAVYEFVRGLFLTEELRTSPYIHAWIRDFAALGSAVFAEMSDEHLEYPHFGTWFGLTYIRHYDDPVVNDLYYLHEIVHAVKNSYEEAPRFTAWFRKTSVVEFEASLETEGYVYLEVPGLREKSFKGEIWADLYLDSEKRLGREHLREVMRRERLRAMTQPHPHDYCERQIAAYAAQNFEWANIWKLDNHSEPAYLSVERHMHWFRASKVGIDEHVRWLQIMTGRSDGGGTPFPDQARLFAPVYWNNKLSYRLRHLQDEGGA